MKSGSRLKSAVCGTEVLIIRYGSGSIECGGAPMGESVAPAGELDLALAGGSLTGKRYIDAAGSVELLCVKGGKGTLALDGVALVVKDAKPLPASD